MCGIIGAIETRSGVLDFMKNGTMHSFIAKRGPDNYSCNVQLIGNWKISLAHSRLSIIDVSELSNQPMVSESEEIIIIFNGEIYNYLEIRSELQSLGIEFISTGDSEVLLKAWERWGENCLSKLNGMFAFVVLNKKKKCLYLIRDRFGVKPLVFGIANSGEVLFSSSINSIASILKKPLNFNYISRGLKFGFFEGDDDLTPFTGVEYVSAGGIVKILLEETIDIQKSIWYDLENEVNQKVNYLDGLSNDDIIEQCSYLIRNATQLRLRSDVPLAVSLSGGIDSSIVASIAKEYTQHLTAFSYGSPSNLKSEGPLVARFAENMKIDVKYIHPTYGRKELGDLLDQTTEAQEAPFYGLSILAQHEVYKRVREDGFRVLIGGQGGDEAFAGYRKYFFIALKESWQKSNYISSINFLYSLGSMLLHERNNYLTYWHAKGRYMNNSGINFTILKDMPLSGEKLFGDGSFQKRQMADIQKYSLPSLLRYEDRNSMYNSIESRLPFLDFRVIEFGLALNIMFKLRNGYGKWILRESFKGFVPDYILKNRVKRGFDVTQNWIQDGVGARLIENIMNNKSKFRDYINDEKLFYKHLTVNRLNDDSQFRNETMILNFIATSKFT